MTEQEYRESIELKHHEPSGVKQIWMTDRTYSGFVSLVVLEQSPEGSKLDIRYNDHFEEPIIVWPEGSTPLTWEEIKVRVAELKNAKAALAYRDQRASEYPPIGDQLDALWKGGDSAAEMLSKIQAVKEKYPKPDQA